MRRVSILISVVLLLFGCTEKGARLSPEELSALVADGLSISWWGYGFSGTAHMTPDGLAHLIVPGRGEDRGEWWLDGEQVCSKWNRVRKGQTLCATVGVFPDGSYELRSVNQGAQWGTFVIKDP